MSKKTEKVLILTLGTGSNLLGKDARDLSTPEQRNERLEYLLKTGDYSYLSVIYRMNGEKKESDEKPTEFVAEPLIEFFNPDRVIIIGTVKSNWASFYTKYGERKESSIRRLFEIESTGNKNTAGKELEKCADEINKIYSREIKFACTDKNIQTQIILTRYGLNKEELINNYELISGIGNCFHKNIEYEIAFDITHSFRSLPIYNLVILNYFKSVSEFDIKISHVYYGNIDVRYENEDKAASIVDLADLVEVMELTNGVSEFRNTGNAATLLRIIPEEENNLKNALEKFDWATQINAFDKVDEALQELLEITAHSDTKNKNRYADLRKMIQQVLFTKYFEQNGILVRNVDEIKQLSVAEKQFATCKWYLNQNRYGQAIATGMETLRSMLVPLYLEFKKIDKSPENCDNEIYRKAAIDRLRIIKNFCDSSKSVKTGIENMFCKLEECRKCAVPVRNVFAHNLKEKVGCSCEVCRNDNFAESGYYCSRVITEQFIRELENLHTMLHSNYKEVAAVYQRDYTPTKQKVVYSNCDNARIVISNDVLSDYSKWKKSASKKVYTVYRPDEKIMKILSSKAIKNSAVFLGRYYQNMELDNVKPHIILEGLHIRQLMHYVPILQYFGANVEIDGKTVGKMEYDINWDSIDTHELSENLEGLLNLPLIRC